MLKMLIEIQSAVDPDKKTTTAEQWAQTVELGLERVGIQSGELGRSVGEGCERILETELMVW